MDPALSTDWAVIASLDLIYCYFVKNRICKTRMYDLKVVYMHKGLHLAPSWLFAASIPSCNPIGSSANHHLAIF
jgi:hypothetical protein